MMCYWNVTLKSACFSCIDALLKWSHLVDLQGKHLSATYTPEHYCVFHGAKDMMITASSVLHTFIWR